MRNFLFFTFILLFINANAQFNKQSKDLTKEEYNVFASEIIEATGKDYVYSKEEKKDNFIKYFYVNKSRS